MKQELWKTIKNFERYEVSNFGNVKNKVTGRILNPTTSHQGYLYVTLCNKEGHKKFKVHRLVAEAFIDNSEGLETVDHIDNNKLNNNALNLQWLTIADNVRKANNKSVSQFYKNEEFIATYASITEASRQTGIDASAITKCCKGKLFTAGGFLWKYEEI